MAKAQKLDILLGILDRIQADPTPQEAQAELQRLLRSPHGIAIARAAKLVDRFRLDSLLPDLVTAFERCLVDPIQTDPGCLAKTTIADIFYHRELNQAELFLKGIRHVQREPVYGGREDTAPQLRVTCALGLVRMHYPQVWIELADLLADPEAPARIGAARAVAYTGDRDRGLPLLRLRVLCGDEPEVVAECLTGLLQLDPQPSLKFVTGFLHSGSPEIQGLVALILGESHRPEVLEILIDWWQGTRDPQLRQTGVLAIAMIRSEQAFEFLLQLISEGTESDAQLGIEALRSYHQDQYLWSQVTERVNLRGLNSVFPADTFSCKHQ